MKGIVIDFLLLTLMFLFLSSLVFFSAKILFPDSLQPTELRVVTVPLDSLYQGRLASGDILFDPITKAKIGSIKSVAEQACEGGFYATLTISAERMPRGNAMRTKDIWFEFSYEGDGTEL